MLHYQPVVKDFHQIYMILFIDIDIINNKQLLTGYCYEMKNKT